MNGVLSYRPAIVRKKSHVLTFCIVLLWANHASADLSALFGSFDGELEETAAVANQLTYESLLQTGCDDQQRGESESCAGNQFTLFRNVRELVHTANELTGEGPTQFGLGVDLVGLGFALRWTAGEEFAAQGDLTRDFAAGQVGGLASRITALRFGATGFNVSGLFYNNTKYSGCTGTNQCGGGASADPAFSPWGGFINGSYTYGNQDAKILEDAFDFDGIQINAGLDYRLSDVWVVGATFGYTDQEINFDATQSIVDGGVTADGISIMPFILYNSDTLFASLSLGYQQLALDSDRAIRYPSLNPDVESTDTRALAKTDADSISYYATLGYTFRSGALSIEPYTEYKYVDIAIDGFTETDINNAGFAFSVEKQKITSNEIAAGINFQYVMTPSFGVFIPYLDIQVRNELDSDSRQVAAVYAGSMSSTDFSLPTETLDDQYYTYAVGVSSVVRGSQKTSAGGASGGVSIFASYKTIQGLDDFSQEIVSGGIRVEF